LWQAVLFESNHPDDPQLPFTFNLIFILITLFSISIGHFPSLYRDKAPVAID
jgi:hypothetical protein